MPETESLSVNSEAIDAHIVASIDSEAGSEGSSDLELNCGN